MFAVVNDVEESADFGEGERDEASTDRRRGFRFGRLVGSIVVLVWLFGLLAPPFLVLCAVTARKVWASMARVICRCQERYSKPQVSEKKNNPRAASYASR